MTLKQLMKEMDAGRTAMFLKIIPDRRFPPRIIVPVVIVDAQKQFGRTEVQVRPIGGSGGIWVTPDRLSTRK